MREPAKKGETQTFTVRFAQWYEYEVEATSPDEAVNQAYKEFDRDVRTPIANIIIDETEVEDEHGDVVLSY